MEKQVTTYFEERIAACKAASSALNADDRADEAVFEKIRMNVYDIFYTIYKASANVCGEDRQKRLEFLFQKLEGIPSDWQDACDKAAKFGHTDKVHVERLKLETAAEIRNTVLKWREKA